MNNFTRKDIKPRYVVELRDGSLHIAVPVGNEHLLILVGNEGWDYLNSWDIDLKIGNGNPSSLDIVAVYGYVQGISNYYRAGRIDTTARNILWRRVEPKKMTVSEISDILGYPVEIVAEKEAGNVKG